LPAASVAVTAPPTGDVDLSNTATRIASPAATCRLAVRLAVVVVVEEVALATRPT
jgi:hypothetical protein